HDALPICLTGHANRAAGSVRSATKLPVAHGDFERIEETSSVNGNLVQIIGSIKVCPALPDVADFRHEMPRKLALNRQIPFVNGGILDVRIEGTNSRSAACSLLRGRHCHRRCNGWSRNSGGKPRGDSAAESQRWETPWRFGCCSRWR